MKRRMKKTNRIQFVKALSENVDLISRSGTLEEWCRILGRCFQKIGLNVYCHKSNEYYPDQHQEAEYHCDVQHDIAKLNSDTEDPSLQNTDPLFPKPQRSVFYNNPQNRNIKVLDVQKLKEVAAYCKNLK